MEHSAGVRVSVGELKSGQVVASRTNLAMLAILDSPSEQI